ncbi:slowpoke-binding protein-like [Amphibalanus amphitrite]|uniref:slowpoke-binding protein-like n=1 Tax=Amphibalanus amphitrite TaxID=1232801 RepID=UPI001C90CE7F|nr:slowpoke-binding protein-like [Amphibalanus amphitrite]
MTSDVPRTTARDLFRSPEPQASTPRKLTRCGRRPSALPNEIDSLSLTGDGPTQIRPRSSPLVTTWPPDASDAAGRPPAVPMTEQQRSAVASQAAASLCQQYLARSERYRLIQPLNDLGCRSNKHWFLVHDQLVKTERLLTITSVTHRPALLQQSDRVKTLRDRLTRAKHPYLLPVLDVDLLDLPQGYPAVVVITPCSHSGSLRDILYKCAWDRDWSEKYDRPPAERLRLPVSQVRRLALQLVEAILHLRRSGIALSFGHLHAGNVIVQNGVARLSDLEASLLEYSPSDCSMNLPGSDVLCIGSLMYEMVAGRLPGPRGPTPADLAQLDDETRSQLGPVLEFIFDNPGGHEPGLDVLPHLEFFRDVHLRELARRPPSLTEIKVLTPVRTPETGQFGASEHSVARSPQRRRKRSSSMPGHSCKELQELRRMHEHLSQLELR